MNKKQRHYRQTVVNRKNKSKKYAKELRRKQLIDENTPFDELYWWSREVRIKDGHKCVICEKTRKLTSHHLFSKSKFPGLKYNIANGIALCFGCHMELHQLNDTTTTINNIQI